MARRRRSRSRRNVVVVLVVATGYLGWSYWRGAWPFEQAGTAPSPAQPEQLAEADADRPHSLTRLTAEANPSKPGPRPAVNAPTGTAARTERRAPTPGGSAALADIRRNVERGLAAKDRGDLTAAQDLLAPAVGAGLPEAEEATVRRTLAEIARTAVFSPECLEGDPLVGVHVVQPGDALARIAKSYKLTADLLAYINAIPDKNRIRIGQRLKVVTGPFHAVIRKDRYVCLVFLQDRLVAEFPVGLGEYGSTPTGEWIAADKLENPTYYPPASRGGSIIAADDPKNPLGEYWIGLKGVSGGAVGQIGYGLHGTIEPKTVGQNVSMGCVRLLNDDIAMLFRLLTADQSHVIIE